MEGKPPERPPTYNQAVYGQSSSTPSPAPAVVYVQSSYSPAPPHAGVHGPTVQPPDIAYLKSPGGIVKIIEAVSCLIAFIIDMTVGYIGSGFTSFATVNGFIQAVIWFVLKLLHAFPQILANYYIELIICCVLLAFLFISFILSAVSARIHATIAAVCFFCFIAMVAYGIDAVFQIVDIRRKFAERRQQRDGPDPPVSDPPVSQ